MACLFPVLLRWRTLDTIFAEKTPKVRDNERENGLLAQG